MNPVILSWVCTQQKWVLVATPNIQKHTGIFRAALSLTAMILDPIQIFVTGEWILGLSWQSTGWDSMLLLQGAQAGSLVEELGFPNAKRRSQKKKLFLKRGEWILRHSHLPQHYSANAKKTKMLLDGLHMTLSKKKTDTRLHTVWFHTNAALKQATLIYGAITQDSNSTAGLAGVYWEEVPGPPTSWYRW